MKLNLHYFLNINKNQKIIINLFIDIVIIVITFFLSKELINYSNLNTLYKFLLTFIFFNTLLSLILKIYLSVKRYFVTATFAASSSPEKYSKQRSYAC